eukprot:m.8061 g.8061  ORF g.8061 m.8061 type:complete len:564 (-) comp6047_c0_seq1:1508-3199(-)
MDTRSMILLRRGAILTTIGIMTGLLLLGPELSGQPISSRWQATFQLDEQPRRRVGRDIHNSSFNKQKQYLSRSGTRVTQFLLQSPNLAVTHQENTQQRERTGVNSITSTTQLVESTKNTGVKVMTFDTLDVSCARNSSGSISVRGVHRRVSETLSHRYSHTSRTYHQEKRIAMALSQYDHFPTVYGFNDDCYLLVMDPLPRALADPSAITLDRNTIQSQLHTISAIFELERILPSREFLFGFGCNMQVNEDRQQVMMYNFDRYEYSDNVPCTNKATNTTGIEFKSQFKRTCRSLSEINQTMKILSAALDKMYFSDDSPVLYPLHTSTGLKIWDSGADATETSFADGFVSLVSPNSNLSSTYTLLSNIATQYCYERPEAAMKRETGWLVITDHFVVKHLRRDVLYWREKRITMALSKHDGFVSLRGYNDNCNLLVLERLQDPFPKHELKDRSRHALNRSYIYGQLYAIWDVMEQEQTVPSLEFYRGFCCNMWLTSSQKVIMYDFGLFNLGYNQSCGNGQLEYYHGKTEINTQCDSHTVIREILPELLKRMELKYNLSDDVAATL